MSITEILTRQNYTKPYNLDAPCPGDTYTLIPNGRSYSFDHGLAPVMVNEYLVQHDQSGETIPWMGSAPDNYENMDEDEYCYCYDYFETFFEWDKRKRKKWKSSGIAMLNFTPGYNKADNILVKENNMHYNNATAVIAAAPSETVKQRDYLEARLYDIVDTKRDEMQTFFKIDPVPTPKTLREAIEKLKSGDFTVDDDRLDRKQYHVYDLFCDIRWTKEKADRSGYEAALEKMYAARTKVMDSISILDPKEGLAALEAFEAQKFH